MKKTIFKTKVTKDYLRIKRIDEHKDGNLRHSTILINKDSINLQIQ